MRIGSLTEMLFTRRRKYRSPQHNAAEQLDVPRKESDQGNPYFAN